MRVMKRTVMLFAACVTAALAMAQDDNTLVNNNAIDAPQTSIEYEEDTTEIMTIDEIVNEQMDVNNRVSKERHMEDVWGRRSYLNLSYSSAKLTPQQTIPTGVDNGIVPAYNTSWGLSLTIGRSYRLHKPAIANILQFNIDYTWLDFNLNHFDHENNGKNLYGRPRRCAGKSFPRYGQKPVLGKGVEGFPVHQDDIQLFIVDGSQNFHLGGIYVGSVYVLQVFGERQIADGLYHTVFFFGLQVINEAFCEDVIKCLAHFEVDICHIELSLLCIHIPPDQVTCRIEKNTQQKQVKLIIIPDILELCGAFQISPCIPSGFFPLHHSMMRII